MLSGFVCCFGWCSFDDYYSNWKSFKLHGKADKKHDDSLINSMVIFHFQYLTTILILFAIYLFVTALVRKPLPCPIILPHTCQFRSSVDIPGDRDWKMVFNRKPIWNDEKLATGKLSKWYVTYAICVKWMFYFYIQYKKVQLDDKPIGTLK